MVTIVSRHRLALIGDHPDSGSGKYAISHMVGFRDDVEKLERANLATT
jgi:hypothetical protein